MRPFLAILAFAVAVSGQRRQGRQQSSPSNYGSPPLASYGNLQADASSLSESTSHDHQGLDWLLDSVPGNPGEDYPIFAEVPDTGFLCDGQIEGGYYADPETDCQAFHVCTADGLGGLSRYSFLCPNGTIFNQEYFICDWWFNVDCSEAENLYSRNEEVAAEREAVTNQQAAAASDTSNSFASPPGQAPLSSYGGSRQSRGRFNN